MKKISLVCLALIATSLIAADGAALTQKCIACHGVGFEKAPLGQTGHVVKGDTQEKIVKMLKYYQHPEEADEMVMKAQVSNLDETQIATIAKYIVGLK